MSNKELAEECVKYGLGKKGNKESLITKLMSFSLEHGVSDYDSEEEKDDKKSNLNADGSVMTDEEKKAGEKLYKMEQAIQKAVRVLMKKNPDGVAVEDVLTKLGELGVKNFKPQLLKFETMDLLLQDMPEYVCEYQEADGDTPAMILPSDDLGI